MYDCKISKMNLFEELAWNPVKFETIWLIKKWNMMNENIIVIDAQPEKVYPKFILKRTLFFIFLRLWDTGVCLVWIL